VLNTTLLGPGPLLALGHLFLALYGLKACQDPPIARHRKQTSMEEAANLPTNRSTAQSQSGYPEGFRLTETYLVRSDTTAAGST
jgi:hypothetical protein